MQNLITFNLKKYIITALSIGLFSQIGYCQSKSIDSLTTLIETTEDVKQKIDLHCQILKLENNADSTYVERLKIVKDLLGNDTTSASAHTYFTMESNYYKGIGKLDEALTLMQKAERILDPTKDLSTACYFYINLSQLYKDVGDYDKMEKSLHNAARIADQHDDGSLLVLVKLHYGRFYGLVKGDIAQGLSYIDEALSDPKVESYPHHFTSLLLAKATMKMSTDYNETINVLKKAEANAIKHEQKKLITDIRNQLVYAYNSVGDLASAVEIVTQNLEDAKKSNDIYQMIVAHNYLGNVNGSLGNDEDCAFHYKEAISIAETNDMAIHACAAMGGLGMHYNRIQKYDKAKLFVEKAVKVADQSGNMFYKRQLIPVLGTVYFNSGDNEKAKSVFLELLESFGDQPISANRAYNGLASYYEIVKDYPKAIKYGIKVLEFAKESNDYYMQHEILNTLRVSAENLKDYKKALEYSLLRQDLSDSLNVAEQQEELTTQKLNIEFEKEKEIAEAKRTAEILQSKNQRTVLGVILGALAALLVLAFFAYRSTSKSNKIISGQKDDLEALNASNEQLLFSLSHDIKEPMLGLQMLLDNVIIKDANLENAKGSLNSQIKSVNRILRSLMEIKKTKRDVDIQMKGSQIIETITDVLESQAQRIENKNLKINLDMEALVGLSFKISPQKFYLLILNTINNAVKYSPKDSEVDIAAENGNLSIVNKVEESSVNSDPSVQGDGVGLSLVTNLLKKTSVTIQTESNDDQFKIIISKAA